MNKLLHFLMKKSMAAAMSGALPKSPGKEPMVRRIWKIPGEVFAPILPAAAAFALLLGLARLTGYDLLQGIAEGIYAFLPVFAAVSAARLFSGNLVLAGLLGLCMVRPGFADSWYGAMPKGITCFFGLTAEGASWPIMLVILSVGVMCAAEKWLHGRMPEKFGLILTPAVTMIVTWPFTFLLLGPFFQQLTGWIESGAQQLIAEGGAAGQAVMGALYPLSVAMGLNRMYNGMEAEMLPAEPWKNVWILVVSAALFAQAGAALAAAFRTRSVKTRWETIPACAAAALGIWEPALFGVSLRRRQTFLAGMAGGAAGALFASLTRISGIADSMSGLAGFLTADSRPFYLGMLLISSGTAFLITWFTWKEAAPGADADTDSMTPASGREGETMPARKSVYSPLKGNVIPAHKIPDALFSTGILGGGVGIEPEEGRLLSPFDGQVVSAAANRPAIGLSGPDGMQVMIHVGIGTSKMSGDGFEVLASEGDQVRRGDCLMTFDLEKIQEAGCSTVTAVLLTNSDEYDDFRVLKFGKVLFGEELLTIEP